MRKYSRIARAAVLLLGVCRVLAAQGSKPDEAKPIVTTVKIVIAPTTVTDKGGNYINGLQPSDFRLYDNEKQQKITQDVIFLPISLVVAIQANNMMESVLPKIQKIGGLLTNFVTGDNGEVAIVAFDHRIQLLQDYTADNDKIGEALKKLKPGSSSSRMIDTVMEAVRMLRTRKEDRRRVILLIGETRDKMSEGRLREALTEAQFANVIMYSVDVSHFVTSMTTKGPAPRPNSIPPEAQHSPTGNITTPNDISQQNLGNVLPAFVEIFKAGKGLFVQNSAEVFTRYTGGKQYSFVKQSALETAIADLGEELHSQYLLSYMPDNQSEAGFHNIRVEVNRANLKIRTRPGYWLAGGQNP